MMNDRVRAFRCVVLVGVLIGLWGWPGSADKPFPETAVHPRLSTPLQSLIHRGQLTNPQGAPSENGNSSQDVVVILEPRSGDADRVRDVAIRLAGGVVEARSEGLIRVRIPLDRLKELADDVSGIVYIREPHRPVPLAVESEGVGLTGADVFHSQGIEGQGARVAVIDLGFDGYTEARAVGELQNVVYTNDYTGNGFEFDEDGVHGTGVAEIVEDMAPQADLYLLKIGDSVDLQNAVQYCIDNSVDVINHSVGWFNSNFYDGTGIIGTIVSNAHSNDILWVNSAGNEANDGHWQGAFLDTDGDDFHEFGSGSDYLDGDSRDEGSRLYATSGDRIIIYMTWDDWTASDQDYDLYIYNSAGTQVASSTNYQNGFQSPTEYISYNVPSTGYYEIAIQAYSAPEEPDFEMYVYLNSGNFTGLEHHDTASTIITPGNSADVLTVGAIRRTNWTTGPQESFSSLGPSNASQYAVSRTKPDIAGPDGTLSTTYGNFYGTSASSPHVAGAAALLLSEDSSRSADDLKSLLETSAIDMGSVGKDNVYGAGRLSLELTPVIVGDEVGYWDFNEGSGSTVNDSSGNANHGTIVGASWTTSVDASGALSFDGVNDYVRVPHSASLDITDELTIEAWIYLPSGYNQLGFVVGKIDETSEQYGVTIREDRHIRIHTWNRPNALESSSALETERWYHIAGVIDGGMAYVYIDGVLDASGAIAPITSGLCDLYIGARGDVGGSSLEFRGEIDEVRIHRVALGAGQFNELPGGGPPAASPPAQVTDFVASDGEDGQVTLSWTNPSDGDLGQVVVQRKEGGYPSDHTDGTTVYDDASPTPGGAVNTVDTGRTNGVTYYYAVFSRDASDWNETVTAGNNADTGTPSSGAPPVGDEVGYWDFNEGSGSTVNDSSGNANHGTIVGASWTTSVDASGALSFDGVNDYVRVPHSASLDITDELTIEAWIYLPSGYNQLGFVVGKIDETSEQYGVTVREDRHIRIHTWNRPNALESSSALETERWYHIAGVIDGGMAYVYIDGALDASGAIAPITSGLCDLYIGARGDVGGSSLEFRGEIDEVRIHRVALGAGQFSLPAASPQRIEQPQPLGNEEVQYQVRPNPVRDDEAVIAVTGVEVQRLRARIFDLTGRMVAELETDGINLIAWDLRDASGQDLANGVYFCVVDVSDVDGHSYRSRPLKLFVLR